jgi:hypothetical protein
LQKLITEATTEKTSLETLVTEYETTAADAELAALNAAIFQKGSKETALNNA